MDILIGSITDSSRREKNKLPDKPAKKSNIDQRKAKQDRRRSVREGIIVTLSIKNDRRSGRDRMQGRQINSQFPVSRRGGQAVSWQSIVAPTTPSGMQRN